MNKKYLGIRLPISEVKKAVYERDAQFFKEALIDRLEEGARQANHFNWRCVQERPFELDNTVVLLFEEMPDSHQETLLTHKINRLLETCGEEEE